METLMNPILIWFLVGLFMFLLESMMPGLIIFFFGVGAWIVVGVSLMVKISLNAQLGIFILASVISLVCFRRLLTKAFRGFKSDTHSLTKDMDDFTGEKVL